MHAFFDLTQLAFIYRVDESKDIKEEELIVE